MSKKGPQLLYGKKIVSTGQRWIDRKSLKL